LSDSSPSNPVTRGNVTDLLRSYSRGDRESLSRAVPFVYDHLKKIAHSQLSRSSVSDRISTTMLVHEAFEKLILSKTLEINDRQHFLLVASRVMRQIVIDTYRYSRATKRYAGEGMEFDISENDVFDTADPERVVHFGNAMESLEKFSPELAEVVDLSCFAGLSTEQISQLTGTTVRTVQRQLARAKAWLSQFLETGSLG